VICNTSGTFLTAATVENEPIAFEINGQKIISSGFLADYVTYYFETSNFKEAYYLSSILNSPILNILIKPMQARGLWGPRDICKTVLELPITQFDENNTHHQRLAEIGKECSKKVGILLKCGGVGKIRSIGKLRSIVRDMLKDELKEIDVIVEGMMK